jgi:hypothetical protein
MRLINKVIVPRMVEDKKKFSERKNAEINDLTKQLEAIKKRINELKSTKDDSEVIDLERKRNETTWLQRDLLAPKAPETIPNVERYVDSFEYAVNKLPTSVAPEGFRKYTKDCDKVNDLIKRLYEKPFGTEIPISTFTDEGSNWCSFQSELAKNPYILPDEDQPKYEKQETPSYVKNFINLVK